MHTYIHPNLQKQATNFFFVSAPRHRCIRAPIQKRNRGRRYKKEIAGADTKKKSRAPIQKRNRGRRCKKEIAGADTKKKSRAPIQLYKRLDQNKSGLGFRLFGLCLNTSIHKMHTQNTFMNTIHTYRRCWPVPWERALIFTPGPMLRLTMGLVTTLESVSEEVCQEATPVLHSRRKLIRTSVSRVIRAGPVRIHTETYSYLCFKGHKSCPCVRACVRVCIEFGHAGGCCIVLTWCLKPKP
jgi:hypothetical protein